MNTREDNFMFIILAVIIFMMFTYTQTSLAQVSDSTVNVKPANATSTDTNALNRIGLNEVNSGQLLFRSDTPGTYHPSLMLSADVNFTVHGMTNHTVLRQYFRNDTDQWLEGVYVFPLPENAAVNKMRIQIGERLIEGKIYEKQQAKKIYTEAKKQGKKASLVEQQRPNMFTNNIANIGPGETIMVELEYIEQLAYRDGQFGLRFPMTITPRYLPGKPVFTQPAPEQQADPFTTNSHGWGYNTDQVSDGEKITPFLNPSLPSANNPIQAITIKASVDMGLKLSQINSDYHNIDTQQQGSIYTVRVTCNTAMNRDFTLNWIPATGSAPQAAAFHQQVVDHHYLSAMLLPPQQLNNTQVLPKEMIFIIDTSGSMGGESIVQAKNSLLEGLKKLRPHDRFNIIEFNSVTRKFFPEAVQADQHYLNQAIQRIQQLRADGGTEMLPALQAALQKQSSSDETEAYYVRQVIFITDGSVGNESELFNYIHNNLDQNRLFTVAIGSAPNSFFMTRVAEFGRGSFTHIGSTTEVQEKMTALFNKLEFPVVSQLQLDWGPLASEAHAFEIFPKRLPDLYQSEPLLLSVKIPETIINRSNRKSIPLTIHGKTGSNPWQRTVTINLQRNDEGVSTIWARAKIKDLMDQKHRGADESQIKPQVLITALEHQLLSPYTSFVAVEKKISRPDNTPLLSEGVPNLRPHGQSPQNFAYPKTATPSLLHMLLGVLLMLFAALVSGFSKTSIRAFFEKFNLMAI